MHRRFFCLLLLLFSFLAGYANNLQIGNVQVLPHRRIRFDVSWENSWALEGIKAPYNHDAAWIFVKFRPAGGEWDHLTIIPDSVNAVSGDLAIETVSDQKGIFVKRNSTGSGSISGTVTLRWPGYPFTGDFEFKVIGIEMVHIEEGSFYVGDGATQSNFRRGDSDVTYHIRSEDAIAMGTDSLTLNDTGRYAPAGTIPAAYPKGFHAFYCMKYELSQEQYTDFLNTLTYSQQKALTGNSPDKPAGTDAFNNGNFYRNGIQLETPGIDASAPAVYACRVTNSGLYNKANDGGDRACNFMSWNSLSAYLDWAALRPMTEFEFEKVCRGPNVPVAQEFAWGTDKVLDANTLVADGTDSEHVKEKPAAGVGIASHGYSGPQGPIRCGFAGTDSTGRLSIGASYYGALEMSGNLWEQCVTVDKQGLMYSGTLGDGKITADGHADVADWPLPNGTGAGFRGGAWNSGIFAGFRDLAVSDRFYAGLVADAFRNTNGGRGVR